MMEFYSVLNQWVKANRLALMVMESGLSTVVKVNLTHDVTEADGMVCGGIMEIYIESLGM